MVVSVAAANPYWPTGQALGSVKTATTRIDVADTITASLAAPPATSAFPIDTKRMAIVHRIVVATGATGATVKLVAYASGGLEDLTPNYVAGPTGTNNLIYDFTPGIIVPGGFGVVLGTANATIHIVYSLLEN